MKLSIKRSIRAKIMALVAIAMIGLLTFLYIISMVVNSTDFDNLERADSLKRIGTLENAVQDEIHSIYVPARDYATWNDTYSFMSDRNQSYVNANLIPETFKNLEMRFIILVDTNGELAFGKEYNSTTEMLDPLPSGMMPHLSIDGPIVSGCVAGNESTGLLMVDGQAVLFVARPILTSDVQGPSMGAMLMGRAIDELVIGVLENVTGLPLQLLDTNDPLLRTELGMISWNELINDQRTIHPLNESTMGGYSLAKDIYGDPGVVLQVSIVRDIHAQGVVSIHNLAILLTLVSLGFGFIIFLLLEKTVVSRLSNLRNEVSRLGPNSDRELQVNPQGEDEIGGLADSINAMLVTIQKAQTELAENEKRYRLLVNSASESIVVVQDGMLRLANPETTALTGYSEKELMSKPFISFIHPDDRAMMTHNHQKRLRGDVVPNRYAIRVLTNDQSFRWLEISGVPIDWEGRPATLNFITDITERKKAEDALRQANIKLGFMSNITRHDINNQLMIINGFIELCKMREKDPELAGYLEKMSRAAANLLGQVIFTKDYQELGVHAPKWSSFGTQTSNAFAMLHPPGVELEDMTNSVMVMADPLAEKVFYNLIDNSLRHGGHVKHIKMSAEPIDESLMIVYEDDGVGISNEDKKHLFEKGFGKNTGDGLFLIREILAITNISITEKGQPGMGVRFEMLVPPGAWRHNGH